LVSSIVFSGREMDQLFTIEGYQDFAAGHVFERTVGLSPVPFLAEDLGDLSAAFVPMIVDGRLDELKIGFGNCSISDGDGQHNDYITE